MIWKNIGVSLRRSPSTKIKLSASRVSARLVLELLSSRPQNTNFPLLPRFAKRTTDFPSSFALHAFARAYASSSSPKYFFAFSRCNVKKLSSSLRRNCAGFAASVFFGSSTVKKSAMAFFQLSTLLFVFFGTRTEHPGSESSSIAPLRPTHVKPKQSVTHRVKSAFASCNAVSRAFLREELFCLFKNAAFSIFAIFAFETRLTKRPPMTSSPSLVIAHPSSSPASGITPVASQGLPRRSSAASPRSCSWTD